VAGVFECGNERSGSIKCGKLLASYEGLCCMELVILSNWPFECLEFCLSRKLYVGY
jgi:hypothetical protein